MRHLLLLTALILPTLTACSMGHCEVDGVHYEVGETWACADGCNSCTCTEDGVSQTDMACNTDTGAVDDTDDTSTSAE